MIQFSDTSTKNGLVQLFEKETGRNYGDVSGNTDKLKSFTVECNLAMDDFTRLAFQASGTFQWDDANHTKYPTATANIVSGQRDYVFLQDEQSNYILEIYKVAILQSSTATQYYELTPVDAQSEDVAWRFDDSNNTGIPYDYDKTANSIFFGTVPNYNATNGILIYFNREASRFAYTDTTKVPGIPAHLVKYLYIKPAEDYARIHSLSNYPLIRAERLALEQDIKTHFGRRERDVRKQITTRPICFR